MESTPQLPLVIELCNYVIGVADFLVDVESVQHIENVAHLAKTCRKTEDVKSLITN